MSLDVSLQTDPGVIGETPVDEARRQIEICNACRYCEGFCSVFPAITRQKVFADGDITQLANLCHNCRGCYYACQYTDPHEFALNLPAALAEVRTESWERFVWPSGLGRRFQRHGVALSLAMVVGFALMMLAVSLLPGEGEGFYAHLAHNAMVAIFLPAFILPLIALGVGVRRYWHEAGAGVLKMTDFAAAGRSAARMRNLDGGQGQGCNFEQEDRYSDARRKAHQAVMWGFLLCFAATSVATLMHYLLGMSAPYGPFALPKLLGVPGGGLLVGGTAWLLWLKSRSNPALGAPRRGGGEYGFLWLLLLTGLSGLVLYALRGTGAVGLLLALHLGAVLTLFLLTPYSKMAHGFFRFTALLIEAQKARKS